jgi:hypothetical protein
MTSLFVFQILLENSNNVNLHKYVIPLTLKLSNDTVANVRFTLAKTLIIPLKLFQSLNIPSNDPAKVDIINCLKKLSSDIDRDVRFYANQVSYSKRICLSPFFSPVFS